ncbi:hypothetical protein LCGC14_2796680 [marine sediment metagenome]|uniref:Uncharacterized protein n=1 Tax=marine sediment metagenome TaxID=412755 RepID=A0A0F9BFC5_9ZZZZ
MFASGTSPLWVDGNASGAFNGSSEYFERCKFLALGPTYPSGGTPAVVATWKTTSNGTFFFSDCIMNATKWAADGDQVQVAGGSVADTIGHQGGKMQAAASS